MKLLCNSYALGHKNRRWWRCKRAKRGLKSGFCVLLERKNETESWENTKKAQYSWYHRHSTPACTVQTFLGSHLKHALAINLILCSVNYCFIMSLSVVVVVVVAVLLSTFCIVWFRSSFSTAKNFQSVGMQNWTLFCTLPTVFAGFFLCVWRCCIKLPPLMTLSTHNPNELLFYNCWGYFTRFVILFLCMWTNKMQVQVSANGQNLIRKSINFEFTMSSLYIFRLWNFRLDWAI